MTKGIKEAPKKRIQKKTMKRLRPTPQLALLLLLLLGTPAAIASLNCTVVAPTVTMRDCEWDDCRVHATATAGAVLHAGCRADCSTLDTPWLRLYDGSYVRAGGAELANCRYFCKPYAVAGLPTCAWEHNQTDPGLAFCAASSLMGAATTKLLGPTTLGLEPSPMAGVPTAGTACDWTKTPVTAPAATTRMKGGGSATTTATNNSSTVATPTAAPTHATSMSRRHD